MDGSWELTSLQIELWWFCKNTFNLNWFFFGWSVFTHFTTSAHSCFSPPTGLMNSCSTTLTPWWTLPSVRSAPLRTSWFEWASLTCQQSSSHISSCSFTLLWLWDTPTTAVVSWYVNRDAAEAVNYVFLLVLLLLWWEVTVVITICELVFICSSSFVLTPYPLFLFKYRLALKGYKCILLSNRFQQKWLWVSEECWLS